MNNYVCITQEGQSAEPHREALAEGLKKIGTECFGDDAGATEIEWIPVRKGFGFTAGKPSTATVVERSVPVGLPQDQRTAFMEKVSDLWMEVTGCTVNEIIIVAWEGPLLPQI